MEFQVRPHVVVLAFTVIATAAEAQYPGRPGGVRGGMGGRGRIGFGDRRPRVIDPVVRDGPLSPDAFARLFELSDSQTVVYASRRDSLLGETQPVRDSLNELAPGPEGGGWRGGGRTGRPGVRRGNIGDMQERARQIDGLLDELEQKQKTFDQGLKESLLTKPQWKRYERWRKERLKEAKEDADQYYSTGQRPQTG